MLSNVPLQSNESASKRWWVVQGMVEVVEKEGGNNVVHHPNDSTYSQLKFGILLT
jgi:hypothetical protein